jgi:hypothetical protein
MGQPLATIIDMTKAASGGESGQADSHPDAAVLCECLTDA